MNSERTAAAGLVFGCVLFGLGSIIVAHVDVGAYAIAFWRLLVASGIFLLLRRRLGQPFPQHRRAIAFALGSGAMLAFDLAFWHESIYAVGPGIATLLNSLQIFFLAAIGYLCFHERQTPLQLVSLLLATVGVACIAWPEFGHNTRAPWGFFFGIASGAMLAGSMACIRKAHECERIAILPLMILIGAGGMAALLAPAFLFDTERLYPATWQAWGWIVVYGAVMQCCAWGLIAWCVPRLSLTLTGLLLLTEPIAALFIDYFFLHKPITVPQWSGTALTLLAIYLGSLKPGRRARSTSPQAN